MGCGRLFEGTAEQMWNSLQKIMQWPDDTTIYCAHEYTQTNAQFALTVEPENINLKIRAQDTDKLLTAGKPTIPTTLALEKKTNPFLRPASAAIRSILNMDNNSDVEVFAKIRQLKDNFR